MKSKVIIAMVVMIGIILGIGVGYNIPHDIQYTMYIIEVCEDGTECAVIEVYDASTDTITMVDVMMQK